MPVSHQTASSVTATPLWDQATGGRHMLISALDSEVRADMLSDLFATVSGVPDLTVWADHTALMTVKLPDDLSYGYHAAGSRNALTMVRLALELADARHTVLEGEGRWLFRPRRTSRLILVVVDLTALRRDDLAAVRAPLGRLLDIGSRVAMPAVALVDPATVPAELTYPLATSCVRWPSNSTGDDPGATAAADDKMLAGAAR